MISAADKSLVDEFGRVSSRAEQMIARVNSCLNATARVAPQFSMLGFLNSQREIRTRLAEAMPAAERLSTLSASEHEEQRSRDALVVRKVTLAIQPEVVRLAEMLEALLQQSSR